MDKRNTEVSSFRLAQVEEYVHEMHSFKSVLANLS
jgi:hypothetical protein